MNHILPDLNIYILRQESDRTLGQTLNILNRSHRTCSGASGLLGGRRRASSSRAGKERETDRTYAFVCCIWIHISFNQRENQHVVGIFNFGKLSRFHVGRMRKSVLLSWQRKTQHLDANRFLG
jgi:hypothetical protein